MLQELFRIPGLGIPIFSYGLMMVIGFLCAIQLAKFLAKRSGIDPEIFVNAGLIALVSGVFGARLSHVLENINQYTSPSRSAWANFLDAINIRSGGLTYYGGFLAAFATLVIYARMKKLPLRLGMDIVAPCIVIGLGFGRIGCFLNGCCYGDRCEAPWAVTFPYHSLPYEDQYSKNELKVPNALIDPITGRLKSRAEVKANPEIAAVAAGSRSLSLHPAQLYSAFTAFLIAGIVLTYFTLPHAPGRGFAMMLMLEGGSRFILETLRVEPGVWGTNVSLSMYIGLGLAILGVILWFGFGTWSRRDEIRPLVA